MSIHGLDVSEFQGTVDWERVKSAGYQFAMLRAGYGYSTLDKQFRRNASECNRIGLPIGVYWFCYALTPEIAMQEAEGCLNAVADYRLDYPVCYDIEQATIDYAAGNGVTVTPSLATQMVTSFCNRVETKGYYAMFYSNRNFMRNYFPQNLSDRYSFWYAYYNNQFDQTNCGMWQYTDAGSVPGIEGNVDLDISFVDYPSVIRDAGRNHLSGDSPVSPSPDTGYITYVIQPGDTLSGIAERYGTTVQVLAVMNGISDPDRIYTGVTLRVPENHTNTIRYYTVQPGDTLSGIALRYGTTVDVLAALNGITDPNLIYAGQRIRI